MTETRIFYFDSPNTQFTQKNKIKIKNSFFFLAIKDDGKENSFLKSKESYLFSNFQQRNFLRIRHIREKDE